MNITNKMNITKLQDNGIPEGYRLLTAKEKTQFVRRTVERIKFEENRFELSEQRFWRLFEHYFSDFLSLELDLVLVKINEVDDDSW